MLLAPLKGLTKVISNHTAVGAQATAIPGNATTLLDGAVTEIISAANNVRDSWGLSISIYSSGAAGGASQACLDLLIGGATDDVLIAALLCGYNHRSGGCNYFFPLHIPQGKRIAGVFASVQTSISCRVILALYGGGVPPWRVGSSVTTYGTQINNARGQAVVPTASGGAASVTEMTASSSRDHFAFLPGFQIATDTSVVAGDFNIGIGVGASAEDRIGTWYYRSASDETVSGQFPPLPAFQDVPSGSRLTMLASDASATLDTYDGLIYAVS